MEELLASSDASRPKQKQRKKKTKRKFNRLIEARESKRRTLETESSIIKSSTRPQQDWETVRLRSMEATRAMGHRREAEIVRKGNHQYVSKFFFFFFSCWVEEKGDLGEPWRKLSLCWVR
jgi:hypothetical protein